MYPNWLTVCLIWQKLWKEPGATLYLLGSISHLPLAVSMNFKGCGSAAEHKRAFTANRPRWGQTIMTQGEAGGGIQNGAVRFLGPEQEPRPD